MSKKNQFGPNLSSNLELLFLFSNVNGIVMGSLKQVLLLNVWN